MIATDRALGGEPQTRPVTGVPHKDRPEISPARFVRNYFRAVSRSRSFAHAFSRAAPSSFATSPQDSTPA